MLPDIHHQCYLKLSEVLQQLQKGDTPIDASGLYQKFLAAQQFFQQQILSLDTSDLNQDTQSRIRSYQTEISKQLRLLEMDIRFLQAAKAKETANTRQLQISDRLKTLQRYCEAILQL